MGELIAEAFPPGDEALRAGGSPKLIALGLDRRANSDDQYTDHMTSKMTATDAKARLLALLDRVAAGEEIEITKHGRSIARLVPAAGPHALRGSLAGVALTADSGDDLLSTAEDWNVA
jgi:prevent-host-death family protein